MGSPVCHTTSVIACLPLEVRAICRGTFQYKHGLFLSAKLSALCLICWPVSPAGMAGQADGGMDMQKAASGRAGPRYQGDNTRPYNEREGNAPGPLPTTGILRLRGLPFGATREDVAEWFNDSGVLLQPINATKQVIPTCLSF